MAGCMGSMVQAMALVLEEGFTSGLDASGCAAGGRPRSLKQEPQTLASRYTTFTIYRNIHSCTYEHTTQRERERERCSYVRIHIYTRVCTYSRMELV